MKRGRPRVSVVVTTSRGGGERGVATASLTGGGDYAAVIATLRR